MWIRWLLSSVGCLIVVLLLLLWWGESRWRRDSAHVLAQLAAAVTARPAAIYSAAELAALPSPVARYFRVVLHEGQPLINRARITWRGSFNLGSPGQDKWKPFTATQEFIPAPPSFVWDARIVQAPGLAVFVRDGLLRGQGSMYGALLGWLPVVNAHDKQTLNEGALQRYLGEAVWLPTALLPSQGVRWEALDNTHARATLTNGGTTVALEFRFGENGLVTTIFAPQRFYDDGRNPPQPLPWQARILRYEEHHGMLVPADAIVEWLFPDKPFPYWRGQPVKIEYEY